MGLFKACTTFLGKTFQSGFPQRNVLFWTRQSRLNLSCLDLFKNSVCWCVLTSVSQPLYFCFTCNLILSLSGWCSPPRWMSVWWSMSHWGLCSSWGPGAALSNCVWFRWLGPLQQVLQSLVFEHTHTGLLRLSQPLMFFVFSSIFVGNCALISPSENSIHTAELLHRLIPFYLDNVSKQA